MQSWAKDLKEEIALFFFPHCCYYLLFPFPQLRWLRCLVLQPCLTKSQLLVGAECSLFLMGLMKAASAWFPFWSSPLDDKKLRAGDCCLWA